MKKMLRQTIITYCLSMLLIAPLLVSCNRSQQQVYTAAERRSADSIVKAVRKIDALDSLYNKMQAEGNSLGEMVVLREKGKILRNDNHFSLALETHTKGLELAEAVNDTAKMVQALNNIGTDYRRMGILDMAQKYHYGAWLIADEFSDSSFTAKKNRVVALNGLANVYLSIGNLNRADSTLRLALAGETALGSLTGQAINCANLGAIFHQRGMADSAWTYYRKSMDLNIQDNNKLGIALCHTYFGDMHRDERKLDNALNEYEQAYDIMKNFRDSWHALNSLIALAGIWIEKDNFTKTKSYLDEAQRVAKEIESNEHLADIYLLYSDMYKHHGDYRKALDYKEQATKLKAGLVDMDKVNRIQNTTLALERERQARQMAEANEKLSREQAMRRIGFIGFIVIIIFMGSLIAMLIHTRRVRNKSHKALAKLNDMRESFFTNITHEFRTPLTVILGLSRDLQRNEAIDNETKEVGKTIERQGHRILILINQLLDISKIRSKIGTPDWRTGNIDAYIGMIVETYTDYAKRIGIKLQFISRDKDIETDFVPDYVTKVISNLLSNALKFTEKYGTINVNLWVEGKNIKIDISDTGRGIDAESLPHIFEEFYQSGSVDNSNGSGIGLALVYQIIKSLNGAITVDSTLGKGTTFHITLPLHKSATPYPAPATDSELSTKDYISNNNIELPQSNNSLNINDDNIEASSQIRILIVEDNADIAAYIGSQLSDNYQITYASNGKQGYEIAHEWIPDIIITDIMMPVMDGLSLCRAIRTDDVTSHIPVIMVTAKVTDNERIEGIKAGADAYLAKPFNSDELQTRVEKLLEQRALMVSKYAHEFDMPIKSDTKASTASTQGQSDKTAISDIDQRFLTKVTDCVYMMLSNQKSIDVNAVAEHLCMTYGQFNRKLTALTGFTPAQYIQRIKIKKAQRMLLAHPELGFNDIAEQCGFADYSNFVRAFKNVCGITPTQYVRQEAPIS